MIPHVCLCDGFQRMQRNVCSSGMSMTSQTILF